MARSVSSEVAGKTPDVSGPVGLLGRFAVPLFIGWTLFVWGGRLRNLAADPGGFSEASQWSLWGSVAFVFLAVANVIALLVRSSKLSRVVLAALVGLTVGVWLLRAVDIALGDHSIGFIVVHVVLAVVSIGLGVLAWRKAPGA